MDSLNLTREELVLVVVRVPFHLVDRRHLSAELLDVVQVSYFVVRDLNSTGEAVGDIEGLFEGDTDGGTVGDVLGDSEGDVEGEMDGDSLGELVGDVDGNGAMVGETSRECTGIGPQSSS